LANKRIQNKAFFTGEAKRFVESNQTDSYNALKRTAEDRVDRMAGENAAWRQHLPCRVID